MSDHLTRLHPETRLPPELNEGYYDIIIFYQEDDRSDVIEYKEDISKVKAKGQLIKIELYDKVGTFKGSKLQSFCFALDRCTLLFIWITDIFLNDRENHMKAQESIYYYLHNKNKQWYNIIPIFTKKKTEFPLNKILGFVSRDGYTLKKGSTYEHEVDVADLIKDTIWERIRKDEELEKECKKETERVMEEEQQDKIKNMRNVALAKIKCDSEIMEDVIKKLDEEDELSVKVAQMNISQEEYITPVYPIYPNFQTKLKRNYRGELIMYRNFSSYDSADFSNPRPIGQVNEVHVGTVQEAVCNIPSSLRPSAPKVHMATVNNAECNDFPVVSADSNSKVEVHHHYHYHNAPPGAPQHQINVIGAKNIHIGDGSHIVTTDDTENMTESSERSICNSSSIEVIPEDEEELQSSEEDDSSDEITVIKSQISSNDSGY